LEGKGGTLRVRATRVGNEEQAREDGEPARLLKRTFAAGWPLAKHSRRGWRLDKPSPRIHIDGVIALAMALDRAENQPQPAELLGWL
jgi:hypothetical protein